MTARDRNRPLFLLLSDSLPLRMHREIVSSSRSRRGPANKLGNLAGGGPKSPATARPFSEEAGGPQIRTRQLCKQLTGRPRRMIQERQEVDGHRNEGGGGGDGGVETGSFARWEVGGIGSGLQSTNIRPGANANARPRSTFLEITSHFTPYAA